MKTIPQVRPADTERLFQVRGMKRSSIQRLRAFAAAHGKRTADVLADAIGEYIERHPIDEKAVRRAS